jgi:hypothetical protein
MQQGVLSHVDTICSATFSGKTLLVVRKSAGGSTCNFFSGKKLVLAWLPPETALLHGAQHMPRINCMDIGSLLLHNLHGDNAGAHLASIC